MVKPTTAKGTKLRVLLGDGGAPIENFVAFCGLTAKGINFQTTTNDFFVPDCDNPDDPAWREITKAGRQVTITGQGILDIKNALSRYQAAYDDADARNFRVLLDYPLIDGGGYWSGAFMLTTFEVTGNDGELVQANITLENNGPVVWVPASA